MALELETYIAYVQKYSLQDNEARLRRLLGRWVSEIEPAVALNQSGRMIGLTVADAPIGSYPFVLTD